MGAGNRYQMTVASTGLESGLPTKTTSDGSSWAPHVPHRRELFTGRPERVVLDVSQQGLRV